MDNIANRPKGNSIMTGKIEILVFLLLSLVITGCQSNIFDKTGSCLFATGDQTKAKTVGSNREGEMVRNTTSSTGGSKDSPWKSTEAESEAARRIPKIDSRDATAYYTAQRPNGAVLFPSKLEKQGPFVVLEPKTLVAPVGEEVVLVASFVGQNNKYLQTKEKLRWSLDGVGHFLTTNPGNCFDGGCLEATLQNCNLTGNKKEYGNYLETTTSTQLWKIHRGTPSPLDDISVLRGQSWATLQSSQEGTTSVTILAKNIDNWENRSASANIYWLDALFLFPKSSTAPAGQAQELLTSVLRKSDPKEARSGWVVRYEVLSGPEAGFGPSFAKEIEVATNADGQANTILTQRTPAAGINQVRIKIIKPAADLADRVVAAEKLITQAWSTSSFFSMKFSVGARKASVNSPIPYNIQVTNLTNTPLSALLQIPLQSGIQLVSSSPQAYVNQNSLIWNLDNIPARKTVEVNFTLIAAKECIIDLAPTIRRKDTGVPLSGTPAPGTNIQSPASNIPPALPGSGPASQPPTLPPALPPAASGGKKKLQFDVVKAIPAVAALNEKFTFALSLANPDKVDVKNVEIECLMPEGITYYSLDGSFSERVLGFGTHPLALLVNKALPFTFVSQSSGEKSIVVKVSDSTTKAVLAEYTARILISSTPAAPGAGGSKKLPKMNVSILVRDQNAPNFKIGTVVPFVLSIKNDENYALSNLMLFCNPEENRNITPWKFVQSEPTGVVHNAAAGNWSYKLPNIPAKNQTELVLYFSPQQSVTNGKFVIEIQSADSMRPIAKTVYNYTIAQKVNRPNTTTNDKIKADFPDFSKGLTDPKRANKSVKPENPTTNNTDAETSFKPIEEKRESESSQTVPYSDTFPGKEQQSNGSVKTFSEKSSEVGSDINLKNEKNSKKDLDKQDDKIDSIGKNSKDVKVGPNNKTIPTEKKDVNSSSGSNKSDNKTEQSARVGVIDGLASKSEAAQSREQKISDESILTKITLYPLQNKGVASPIVNFGIKGKNDSARKEKDRTSVGQKFTYNIVVKNGAQTLLPANAFELIVKYDNVNLNFLPSEFKATDFKVVKNTKQYLVLQLAKEMKPLGQFDLSLPFDAVKKGETNLNIELVSPASDTLYGIFKLPLLINSDK